MKKLTTLYERNAVFRFVLSYLLVLIVPLVICITGTMVSVSRAQQVMEDTKVQVLDFAADNLEREIRLIQNKGNQLARSTQLGMIEDYSSEITPTFLQRVADTLSAMQEIVTYRGTEFLSGLSAFLTRSNSYLCTEGYYNSQFYYRWKSGRSDLDYEQWSRLYSGEDAVHGLFNSNGNLQYVISLDGDRGSVICEFQMERLQEYFETALGSAGSNLVLAGVQGGDYSVYDNGNLWIPSAEDFTQDSGMVIHGGYCYTYAHLGYLDCYMIHISETGVALQDLYQLQMIEFILIFAAILGGICLAYVQSRKQGRVVNEFFRSYTDSDENMPVSVENMGKVAAKIAESKAQVVTMIERERPLLEQALLGKLVRGEEAGDNELDSLAEQVGFNIDADAYQVVLYRIYNNIDPHDADIQTIEESRIISYYVRNLVAEYLKDNYWFYELNCLTTVILYIPQPHRDSVEELVNYVEKRMAMEGDTQPFWGAAKPTNSAMKIWRVVEKARYSLDNVSKPGVVNMKYYGEVVEDRLSFYFSDQYRERLRSSIISDDRSQIVELMNISRAENFEHGRKLPRNQFLKLNTAFVNLIISLCDNQIVTEEVQKLNELAVFYGEWKAEEYYQLLQEVIYAECDCMNNAKKSKSANLVIQMKKFVEANYSDSGLGLSMMSQNFHISEGYVSMLFKEQAGVNFAEYVERLRIGHATDLLKNSSMPIQEISDQVGYNSIQSFRRAIKRITGKTPKEVRDEI